MKLKRPFEFDITPHQLRAGTRWVSVHLKNVSTDKLTELDVKLYSRNPSFIDVLDTGSYTSEMSPKETRIYTFQVNPVISTKLYATVAGYRDGTYFFWTSPNIELHVGTTSAKLNNVFALTHPYATEETIESEAVIEGVVGGEDLKVVFWHDSPSSYDKLGETTIENVDVGEIVKTSIEFTPEESGIHEIYAFLYDDGRYIGSDSDVIWIE